MLAAAERMRAKFPTAAVAAFVFHGEWDRLGPGAARLACFVTLGNCWQRQIQARCRLSGSERRVKSCRTIVALTPIAAIITGRRRSRTETVTGPAPARERVTVLACHRSAADVAWQEARRQPGTAGQAIKEAVHRASASAAGDR